MQHLKDKVAIVTGGGRGLGRAHALALAKMGAAVVVNDLGGEFSGDGKSNHGPANDVVQIISGEGGRALANSADISAWDQAATLVEAALSAFGRLDVVVNNAGIARFGTIDRISRRDWERTIDVNLTGTAALSHWAAAHWREAGPEAGRRIVNTTSGVGLTPQAENPMYVAAKAGVAAFTLACAIELADLGVRVNGVAPAARSRISEFVAGEMMSHVPEGFDRMSPEHSATVVAYLASPLCSFTGRIFGVVGDDVTIFEGWTAPHHVANGEQSWTIDALHSALSTIPAQQQGQTQAGKGTMDFSMPPDNVLELLTHIENK